MYRADGPLAKVVKSSRQQNSFGRPDSYRDQAYRMLFTRSLKVRAHTYIPILVWGRFL